MNFTQKRTRVILADDHEMLRRGFQSLLLFNEDIELVAHVSNGQELVEAVHAHLPDLVITDIKMRVMDGIEATKLIKTDHPEIKVIAFSSYGDGELIDEMLGSGANGYLVKNASKEEVIKGIRSVMQGNTYFCEVSLEAFLKREKKKQPPSEPKADLSEKEIQVMCLTARGKSSREIAKEMCLSTRTIDWYRQCLKTKLGLSSIAGIVHYATKHGYL